MLTWFLFSLENVSVSVCAVLMTSLCPPCADWQGEGKVSEDMRWDSVSVSFSSSSDKSCVNTWATVLVVLMGLMEIKGVDTHYATDECLSSIALLKQAQTGWGGSGEGEGSSGGDVNLMSSTEKNIHFSRTVTVRNRLTAGRATFFSPSLIPFFSFWRSLPRNIITWDEIDIKMNFLE